MKRFPQLKPIGVAAGIMVCFLTAGWSQVVIRTGPQQAGTKIGSAELIKKLDAHLKETSDAGEFSGVALLAKDGIVVFQKPYGLASKEYDSPNNLETKFNLGSIDKVFTKIAIGQLLVQGKIGSVDDKLERYLPDYPNHDAASKVTLRQILNMQSGIGDFFGPAFMSSPKNKYRTIADFLPLFADKPLAFEPGTKRQYSNGGYIVLGAIIEKVSGQSYYDYVRENIFKPLGMESTDFYEADVPTTNVASGYSRDRDDPQAPRRNNIYTRPARGSSAGGGYSDAGDLLKFANAIDAGKIKNPAFEEGAPKPANALFATMKGVGAAGGAPGINAVLETALPGGYTIIVLSNYDPPSAEKVSEKIHEWMGLTND
jgi:CubicO group peptidase (beta-lactamase class C family)